MDLDRLLSEIGLAARKADFARLTDLSAMLETVSLPQDNASLSRLARQARDNAVLLQASAQGLRAAQRRIRELRDCRRVTTYDGTGRKSALASPPARTHRV